MLLFFCVKLRQFTKLYKTFVCDTCIKDMIRKLWQLSEACIKEMQYNEKMKMTSKDRLNFNNSNHCHICGDQFDDNNTFDKLRDYVHRTSQYGGTANSCSNTNYFKNGYLPGVFHNLKRL